MPAPQPSVLQNRFGSVQAIIVYIPGAEVWAVNLKDCFGVATDWNFREAPEAADLKTIVGYHVRQSAALTRRN